MKVDNGSDPDITAYLQHIASWIRQERLKAKLSQMELSLKAGLSENHVYAIETGARFPNMATFLRICKALNVNPAISFIPPSEERQRDKETILSLIGKYL